MLMPDWKGKSKPKFPLISFIRFIYTARNINVLPVTEFGIGNVWHGSYKISNLFLDHQT